MEYVSGDPAPHFNLRDTAGRPVMLYDYYGKANVVLAFLPDGDPVLASAIAAALKAAAPSWRDAGAEIVCVAPDTADAARAFAVATGVEFPLLADDDRSVSREYGAVRGGAAPAPSLFVIDRAGDIRLVVKSASASSLGDAIATALRALPA